MEKAKNIVLVICGTILFFGSRAASAFGCIFLLGWQASVC